MNHRASGSARSEMIVFILLGLLMLAGMAAIQAGDKSQEAQLVNKKL